MIKNLLKRLGTLLKLTMLVVVFVLLVVLVVSVKSCNKTKTTRVYRKHNVCETQAFPTLEIYRFSGESKNEITLDESLPEISLDESLPAITPPPIETTIDSEKIYDDGFKQINGLWYYYEDNVMITNDWREENGGLYYFLSDGQMAIGWVYSGEEEYCFYASGAQIGMLIRNNWSEPRSDGTYSYMGEDGRKIKDTVKDGYTIDSNGIAIQ